MGYFPIERPGKKIDFNSQRTTQDRSKGKEKKDDKKRGSFGVPEKPEENDPRGSKYSQSLLAIKEKTMGINKNVQSKAVKPWTFDRVRSDSKSPELRKYGDSLSRIKSNVEKKK